MFITRMLSAAIAALVIASPAVAQSFPTPTNGPSGPTANRVAAIGNGKAVILTPFQLLQEQALNFGSYVLPTGQSGSVSLDPVTGAVTPTTVVPIPSNAPLRGKMDFAGTANQPVTVQVTSFSGFLCAAQSSCSSGLPTTLTLDGVQQGTTGIYNYTVPASGVLSFYIGGTVGIPAATASGTYGESFQVTLSYN
ncbi:DUF4402 domain-containing protein [Sphingomonas sp. ASV193]|uniref:DUF4402 domain-containing protein n=1 Tax=Sphingomonas sp. ASV193 TaxID=3144405 RepID=UPI0032E89BFC